MIYFPNKIERYLAVLRNTFHLRIIKNGMKRNYLQNLKKIYITEALLFTENPQPIDLQSFCAEILTAVFLKKLILRQSFDFSVDLSGNYMVCKKLFTVVLLNIASNSQSVKIYTVNGRVVIQSVLPDTDKMHIFAKKLDGFFLQEKKTKNAILTAFFAKTQKKTRDYEKAYELLENPLSVVNFYLSR